RLWTSILSAGTPPPAAALRCSGPVKLRGCNNEACVTPAECLRRLTYALRPAKAVGSLTVTYRADFGSSIGQDEHDVLDGLWSVRKFLGPNAESLPRAQGDPYWIGLPDVLSARDVRPRRGCRTLSARGRGPAKGVAQCGSAGRLV